MAIKPNAYREFKSFTTGISIRPRPFNPADELDVKFRQIWEEEYTKNLPDKIENVYEHLPEDYLQEDFDTTDLTMVRKCGHTSRYTRKFLRANNLHPPTRLLNKPCPVCCQEQKRMTNWDRMRLTNQEREKFERKSKQRG